MKIARLSVLGLALAFLPSCNSQILEDLSRGLAVPGREASLDEPTISRGLKEALSVGTRRAINTVSATDGYFRTPSIRIVMPERMREVAEVLGRLGFQKQVDEFTLSMNRAAEKAAPKAAELFAEAVRDMTFDDARRILNGGNTAATEYLRQKTGGKIYAAFKPLVISSMNEVGTTRAYNKIMSHYAALPFASQGIPDLDTYVTNGAVDGLFYMLGEEEKRIRTNPAARVSELLRRVFGSSNQ